MCSMVKGGMKLISAVYGGQIELLRHLGKQKLVFLSRLGIARVTRVHRVGMWDNGVLKSPQTMTGGDVPDIGEA